MWTMGAMRMPTITTEEFNRRVVDHPPHYTQGGIECIDAIEAMVKGMPPETAVRLSHVLRYIWRHHQKDGLTGLRKAAWYLRREIEAQELAVSLANGLKDLESGAWVDRVGFLRDTPAPKPDAFIPSDTTAGPSPVSHGEQ